MDADNVLWPEGRAMTGFYERFWGLISEPEPSHRQAYWFPRCRAIHTFGMKAPIDVIALDKALTIVSVTRNLLPRRVRRFQGCYGVLELAPFCPWPLESWLGRTIIFESQGEHSNDSSSLIIGLLSGTRQL